MRKTYKILLSFVFIILSGFIFTVTTSAAIKESSKDFDGDTYVIGSTKFDSNTVITATRAAQAGSDDAALRLLNNNFERVEIKTYYYSELTESWFLIPEEGNKKPEKLTEKETKELEDNLNIYFVNNEEKVLEVEYSGSVDLESIESYGSITDKKVVYKDGKFYIPVTTMDVRFEDESGEEVYITTPYNDETGGYELGEFFIPVTLTVLDENGKNVSTLQAQEDGTINNIDQIFYHTKTGYELYYVNTKGEKVDFNDFKVLENTTIKQAWSPVGNIHSFDSMYNSETKVLTYCGTVYKNENGYYVPVTIQAPQGYNTSNTKVNGKTVTFTEETAVVDVTVTEKGVEIPIVVEWENGIEVTFKLLVDANASQTYSVTYYDAKDEVLEQFNNVMINEQVQETLKRPSKEGYVFAGWTTNKETNEKIDFTNQYVTGDMKFYPIFKTLEEAIETSSHDNPVVLYDDVVINETIILDVNQDMVLDLNGHRITSEGHNAFRLKGTNTALTVRNGYINVTGGAAIAVGASKEDTTNVERRYLRIEPTVYITSSSMIVDNKTISAFGITHFGKSEIDFHGNITINGSGYGISGNGLANNEGTILNIYEGTITAPNGAAIYQPQLGNLEILGGTFEANTVIGVKAGNIVIRGGSFKSTGELNAPKSNGNGFDLTGDIILAEENDAYADHVYIDILGGSFDNSNGGAIVREFNPSLGTENERYVTVVGNYATRKTTSDEKVFVYEDTSLATLEVGGIKYTSKDFKFALEKSNLYSPLKLLTDISLEEQVLIDASREMVLDLNDHQITSEGHNAIRLKGTNTALTVRNGYINVTGGTAIAVGASKEDTTNVERRYLKIEPTVYITSSSMIVDNKTISAFGITHFGKSEIDFYGNITINGSGYGISGNGLANNEGTILNIYSGNITAMDGAAIYQPQLGTSNISGGTFMANTVIGIKAGTLNITGGTFTANGAAQPPKPNGNGFDLTGDVIIAEENDAYADHVQINITGGSFYSSNGEIIREYNPSLGTENERYVTVSGLYSNRVSTENPIIFIYKAN